MDAITAVELAVSELKVDRLRREAERLPIGNQGLHIVQIMGLEQRIAELRRTLMTGKVS